MENSKDSKNNKKRKYQTKMTKRKGAQIQSIILYSTAKTLKNNGYLMQKKMQFFY